MEEQSKQILDLVLQPAFLAVDGIIRWCNSYARPLVDEGTAVERLLGENIALFDLWTREDTLLLPMELGGGEYDVSVRALQEGTLFVAERRLAELDTAAQAMVHISACLRKPLHAMMTAARELFDRVEEDPCAADAAAQLNRTIYQLLRLSGQMSDGGRLMQRSVQAHRKRTELKQYFDALVDEIRPLVEAAGRRLEYTTLPHGVQGWIDGDLLERAVYNLAANAMQYTREGGVIRLSIERAGKKMLAIRMSDNGTGVSPSDMAHLFEHFAESAGGDSRWGLGMGLTMVREIARLHGGTVMISAGSREGTTAMISVSLAPCADELRTPVLHYDYCSGLHHGLVELSGSLPAREYDPEQVR